MPYRASFLKLVSGTDQSVISAGEIGAQLKLNSALLKAQSNLLDLIAFAVQECAENVTRRDFLTKTWNQKIDWFPFPTAENPLSCIELQKSILQVDEEIIISYLKNDNITNVAVDTADYYIDESPDYSKVLPVPNIFWPRDVSDRLQSVNIQFKSGYGDVPKDVPRMLRMAMLQHAAYFYANRGDCACTAANMMEIAPPEAMAVYENNQILFMAL